MDKLVDEIKRLASEETGDEVYCRPGKRCWYTCVDWSLRKLCDEIEKNDHEYARELTDLMDYHGCVNFFQRYYDTIDYRLLYNTLNSTRKNYF